MEDKNWQATYDDAWSVRRDFLASTITEGETDPHRLVHRLYAHERFNFMIKDDAGAIGFAPADHANNQHKFPLLPTGVPAFRVVANQDRFALAPFYAHPMDFLVDYLRQNPVDAVVELGSGYGRNLVELFYRGGPKGVPYYAGELSENGTEMARMLAQKAVSWRLVPFRFDHNRPDLSPVAEKGRVLFFTLHTIEQVAKLREDYFKILADHATQAIGVHFEPFGFQIGQYPGEVNDAQQRLFLRNGWNTNMVEVLKASANRGDIKLTFMAKNMMGSDDPENPTSLAVWRHP